MSRRAAGLLLAGIALIGLVLFLSIMAAWGAAVLLGVDMPDVEDGWGSVWASLGWLGLIAFAIVGPVAVASIAQTPAATTIALAVAAGAIAYFTVWLQGDRTVIALVPLLSMPPLAFALARALQRGSSPQ